MTEHIAAQAAVLAAFAEVLPPGEVWPDVRVDDLALSHDALDHAAQRITATLGVALDEHDLAGHVVREVAEAAARDEHLAHA